ncbi:MAG: hypothetical protein K5639_04215 [Eubacterium sp.]|nr:hypothetical protein [Eubacterium sp.]
MMGKWSKRFIVMALGAFLALGLVGCGDDSSSWQPANQSGNTNQTAEKKEEATTQPEATPEQKAEAEQTAEKKDESEAKEDTGKKTEASEEKTDSDKKDKAKSSESKLVGTWKCEYDLDKNTKLTAVYVFNDDGTGSYDLEGQVTKFTYKDNGKKLTIKFKGTDGDMKLKYKISGDKFTYKDITGNKVEFIRQ